MAASGAGVVNHTGTITNSGTGTGVTTISSVIGSNVTGVTQNSATSSMVLSGVNTYTSGTSVAAGKLTVNGAGSINASSGVTVNGSTAEFRYDSSVAYAQPLTFTHGTLSGTGTISVAVTAGSGPTTVAPAGVGGVGTFTLGSTLAIDAASTLSFDINGATPDLLAITGALSVTGLPSLAVTTSGTLAGDYTLATFASSGLTNANFTLGTTPSGYNWSVGDTFIKLVATVTSLPAGSGTWHNGTSDNTWTTNTGTNNNWITGIPSAAGQIATFDDTVNGGTPGTVDMNGSKTVGGIAFNSTVSGYAVGLASTADVLTLDNGAGVASVTASGNKSHTINARTTLASDTTVTTSGTAEVTFAQGISNVNKNLSFAGTGAIHANSIDGAAGTTAAALAASGTTALVGDVQVDATRIRQHTLTIGDGTTSTGAKLKILESAPGLGSGTPSGNDAMVSVVSSLSLNTLSTLDLVNNDLIIDYTVSGSSPLTTIEALVKSGYHSGDWNGKGITSSTAAGNPGLYSLVVLDNATRPTPFPTFDGIDTSSHQQVIVKFSWVADIDLDGLVTSNDAIAFAANYSDGAAANHQRGDLNYNGIFDSGDAILFATAYNESLAAPARTGIPESAGHRCCRSVAQAEEVSTIKTPRPTPRTTQHP